MSDGVPGTMAYELANMQPTMSNYLAPWVLYAFDWCKWQPGGNSAGKVAIGSYLEDGHNFVSDVGGSSTLFYPIAKASCVTLTDPNPRHPNRADLAEHTITGKLSEEPRIH
jgi:WD repeat-containing protein 68